MSYYRAGDWNVICARSGMKFKRSECKFEWDGKLVAKKFWKPRHPQDLPPHIPKPSIPDYVNPPTFNNAAYPNGILLDGSGEPITDNNNLWILSGA